MIDEATYKIEEGKRVCYTGICVLRDVRFADEQEIVVITKKGLQYDHLGRLISVKKINLMKVLAER